MRSVFSLIGEHDCAINDRTPTLLTALMTIHKKNTQMASGPPEHHVDREGRRLADRSWNFVVAAEKRVVITGLYRAYLHGVTLSAWEEQIKSPSSSSTILSKLQSISSFSPAGSWPVAQMAAFNPFGVYMQIAQQWQKTCSDAMGVWANANKPISWRT